MQFPQVFCSNLKSDLCDKLHLGYGFNFFSTFFGRVGYCTFKKMLGTLIMFGLNWICGKETTQSFPL